MKNETVALIKSSDRYRALIAAEDETIAECEKRRAKAKRSLLAAQHEVSAARLELEDAQIALTEAEQRRAALSKERTAAWNAGMRKARHG